MTSPASAPTRILFVDDESLVREGLRQLLLAENDSVDVTAASPDEAAMAIRHIRPHLIFLDQRMQDASGLAFLRTLPDAELTAAVALLTSFNDRDLFLEALNLGVNGLFLKNTNVGVLHAAVDALLAGAFVAGPGIDMTAPLHRQLPNSQREVFQHLSPEELAILHAIAAGKSNREIANDFHMSVGLVKKHISRIFDVLHVRDRVSAAILADRSRVHDTP